MWCKIWKSILGSWKYSKAIHSWNAVPPELRIEVTNRCNAACIFCAYSQMHRKKTIMDFPTFKKAVDQYIEMGGKNISLTPVVGDPLLDPLLKNRLSYLANLKSDIRFYFYTNGILLNEKLNEFLLKLGSSFELRISLGGLSEGEFSAIMGRNGFDQVWSNIEHLIQIKKKLNLSGGLRVALRTSEKTWVGSRWDYLTTQEKLGTLSLEKPRYFDTWSQRIDSEELNRHQLPRIVPSSRRGACVFLYTKPICLTDGRVSACGCRDMEGDLIIGNLKNSSLKNIWLGSNREKLLINQSKGKYDSICSNCDNFQSIKDPDKMKYHL
jgi:MoaA/NifB/PqqE/SkfB family radical SAM enzyme